MSSGRFFERNLVMRFVPTANLTPGMITTKAIYLQNTLFVGANRTLTKESIKTVQRVGIPGLYIFDEYSDFEKLNEIVNEELRYRIVSELRDFNIDQVIYLTNQIVDDVLAMGDELLIDLNELCLYDEDTYQHSVNVATLATTCGVGLGLGNEDLKNLALAGALHDIGKRAIPIEILNKEGKLTKEERLLINEHPRFGFDMLYDNNNISAYVRSAILSHHENYDGSGYPNRLKEDEIPFFGMIIHVVDVYDALIRKRSYKDDFAQQEAIEYLMGNCGIMFDLDVVQTFLNYLVVFPVGTVVTLSNGKKARVVQNRRRSILRPVVVTVEDKITMDLANDPKYFNVTILEGE